VNVQQLHGRKRRKLRKLDLTKPVERPRMPLTVILRVFVLGSVAIAASGYALYRHYGVTRPSMLMAVPPEAPSVPEADASELLPVPELVPDPAPAPRP
jgi:hypothetical protein